MWYRTGGNLRRDFIRTVQHKVAISALPASALRGQGEGGVTAAARSFLRTLDLSQFAVSDATRFAARLDQVTNQLRRALPPKCASWGIARKAVNLFLRDAFYNTYLRNRFKLSRAEACFELPLDGVVAKGLRKWVSDPLPRWRGVKHLTPEASGIYQRVALKEALRMHLRRVHLDIYLWTERPIDS